jgi:CBS domain-containing protein
MPDTQPPATANNSLSAKEANTGISRRARADKVSAMHTDDYVCIEPTTPLSAAIEAMKKDEGGCAIVCEGESVVGIFTERDLLTKIVGNDVDMQAPVSNWMSPAVSTLTPDATIGDAVSLMNDKSFRNIPLVKDGKLVGSISVFDVIFYLAESYPKETMNLPPMPDQIMAKEEGG